MGPQVIKNIDEMHLNINFILFWISLVLAVTTISFSRHFLSENIYLVYFAFVLNRCFGTCISISYFIQVGQSQ